MERHGQGMALHLVSRPDESLPDLKQIFSALGFGPSTPGGVLPINGTDMTAGSEMELQAAVAGRRETVDLPETIEQSSYIGKKTVVSCFETGKADTGKLPQLDEGVERHPLVEYPHLRQILLELVLIAACRPTRSWGCC